MLDQYQKYFDTIDLPPALRDRVGQLCQEYAAWIDGKIDHLVISDDYNSEGNRIYKSIFLVYRNRFSEIKDFVTSDNFDIYNLDRGIKLMEVRKQKFSTLNNKVTAESRMTVTLFMGTEQVRYCRQRTLTARLCGLSPSRHSCLTSNN